MDWTLGLGIGMLVWAAFAFDLVGFMLRDELWWRGLMFAASCLYLFYYYFVTETPLWDAFLTNMALGVVNLWMIGVVIMERTTFSMSPETAALYQKFHLLTPGQFRKLLKLANETADADTPIITEGQKQEALYFLVEGSAQIQKDQTRSELQEGSFMGEIAYVTGAPASATINLAKGAKALAWPRADLQDLTRKVPAIGTALAAHLNSDMALKLARSAPATGNPGTLVSKTLHAE